MRRSLLWTLFRLGTVPWRIRPMLEDEGIVLLDEGIPGSITYRNFRAPGRRHSLKSVAFAGSLVLTNRRFAAFAFSRPVLNVPPDDPRLDQVQIEAPDPGTFTLSYDVALFRPRWSGTVTVRYRTPLAPSFVEQLGHR